MVAATKQGEVTGAQGGTLRAWGYEAIHKEDSEIKMAERRGKLETEGERAERGLGFIVGGTK